MNAMKIVGLGTLGALFAWSVVTGENVSSLPAYLISFNAIALAAALGSRHSRRHCGG